MTREEILHGLENIAAGEGLYDDRKPLKRALILGEAIKAIEQEPNTWNLDDAREDFMSDVYNTLDFLPTNNEANRIIDSFDRVTSNIKKVPKTGHWIMTNDYYTGAYETIDYVKCSCCREDSLEEGNYCPNCGAKMSEIPTGSEMEE